MFCNFLNFEKKLILNSFYFCISDHNKAYINPTQGDSITDREIQEGENTQSFFRIIYYNS